MPVMETKEEYLLFQEMTEGGHLKIIGRYVSQSAARDAAAKQMQSQNAGQIYVIKSMNSFSWSDQEVVE